MSEPPSDRNIDVDGNVEDSQVVSGDRNLVGDKTSQINQEVTGDRNQVIGEVKDDAIVFGLVKSGTSVTID